MTDNFAPFFPMSLQALEAGFRLPLSGLGVALCRHLGVTPGQLSPESWRYITAHVQRSRDLGRMPPTLEDFRTVHTVSPIPEEYGLYRVAGTVRFRWYHPEPSTDWCWRWFLIRPPSGSPFPRIPGPARW